MILSHVCFPSSPGETYWSLHCHYGSIRPDQCVFYQFYFFFYFLFHLISLVWVFCIFWVLFGFQDYKTTRLQNFIRKNYNKCNFDNTHNKQALTYILGKSKFLSNRKKGKMNTRMLKYLQEC